jgi:signal transduction histidine kinase
VLAGELPSRVFVSGESEWSLDITTDPNFSGAEVAKQVGLKAAFAFPVLVGKEAVAVMEFFSAEAVEPDASLLDVMTNIGTQLGRVFERKQVERQLNENERLAAMGVTVAKLIHEIGNPLNGMYTTVQLLERDLAQQEGPLNETLRLTVQDLIHEVDRLRSLLLELRSLSHPRQLDLQPTDLAALTTELLSIEMPQWAKSGIRVEQDFPPDLPLVLADGEKLKQVLLNLCKNAVEAMSEEGTLTVRGHTVRGQVYLEIHDTGVGVPDGVDVFELFSTTKPGGTGIGLAIVRQIVAAHGGRITYTSRPGKGTVFRVTLPLRPLPEGQRA